MEGEALHTIYYRARQRTMEVLFSTNRNDRLTHVIDISLIVLISLNVLAVVLESEQNIKEAAPNFFYGFELVSVVFFSIEYIARVWSTVDNPFRSNHRHPILGRLRYMFTWFALIDLIAIAPFYLGLIVGVDLRILRALRLLRIFKLTRYSSSMTMLFNVFREESRTISAAMFVSMLLMFMASTLVYIFEHKAQPHIFSSIPASMYWAVITMTTVGYGDMVPITIMGKVLSAVIGVLGLGMVALPAGILASGFNNALHRSRLLLEEKVSDVMEDGVITEQEQADLDALLEKLNLNEVDERSILQAIQHQREQIEHNRCPHCGMDLSDPIRHLEDDD